MRRPDCGRRHDRHQRRSGVHPPGAPCRDDRPEHHRRQLDGPQCRVSHARQRAGARSTGPPLWHRGGAGRLGDAHPRHRPPGREHPEVRYPMRPAEAGLAVPGPRQKRQGSGRGRDEMPAGRRLHRPEALRRSRLERHPRRREFQRRHSLHGDLRRQSAAVRAELQGPVHPARHAGLREHRDGAARGPHCLHPWRQRHGRPDHHRRRQARTIHQCRWPTRSSMPRRFSALPSR